MRRRWRARRGQANNLGWAWFLRQKGRNNKQKSAQKSINGQININAILIGISWRTLLISFPQTIIYYVQYVHASIPYHCCFANCVINFNNYAFIFLIKLIKTKNMKNFAPNHPLRLKILIDKVPLIPIIIPCWLTDFITLFYFYLYFYVGVLTSHDSLPYDIQR